MGGYEWRHEKYWGDYNQFGLYPSTNTANAGKKYNEQNKEWKSEHYLVSFYGRLNYSAFDRYMLTATFRADGSSRFPKKNRWGYFPSVALGWKINNEPFLRSVKQIDELESSASAGVRPASRRVSATISTSLAIRSLPARRPSIPQPATVSSTSRRVTTKI